MEDTLCGLVFRLSPRSFYQVNHHQAQRLYETAIAHVESIVCLVKEEYP